MNVAISASGASPYVDPDPASSPSDRRGTARVDPRAELGLADRPALKSVAVQPAVRSIHASLHAPQRCIILIN